MAHAKLGLYIHIFHVWFGSAVNGARPEHQKDLRWNCQHWIMATSNSLRAANFEPEHPFCLKKSNQWYQTHTTVLANWFGVLLYLSVQLSKEGVYQWVDIIGSTVRVPMSDLRYICPWAASPSDWGTQLRLELRDLHSDVPVVVLFVNCKPRVYRFWWPQHARRPCQSSSCQEILKSWRKNLQKGTDNLTSVEYLVWRFRFLGCQECWQRIGPCVGVGEHTETNLPCGEITGNHGTSCFGFVATRSHVPMQRD